MAYELRWSQLARDDLRAIIHYISQDSVQRAQSFALRLMAQADKLPLHPECGQMVPEYHLPHLRELIFRPYRIVYRLDHERRCVEVIRVWHSSRGSLRAPPGSTD